MGRKRRLKPLKTHRNSITADWKQKLKRDMSNSLEMKARQRLGNLECEITTDNHRGLQRCFALCEKNPNHLNSTPVHSFCRKCLPIGFQTPELFDCCLKLIALTCLIKVSDVSKDRPPELRKMFETCGKTTALTGSGGAFIPKERKKGESCPCAPCKSSGSPSKTWFIVWVSTAHHVVFDDFEAQNSEIWMHYDHEEGHPNSRIKKLQGHRIVNFSEKGDRSILECITHDAEVVSMIWQSRSRILHYETLFKSMYQTHRKTLLSVIVSHPHGLVKRISFGTTVDKIEVEDHSEGVVWTSYRYNAPTCRGSSGALVWFLGQKRVGYRDKEITTHTHKMGLDKNKNGSSLGLDFADKNMTSHHFKVSTMAWRTLCYILCHFLLCILIHLLYSLHAI